MSNMYKVVMSASAKKDLQAIAAFYKNKMHEPNIAKRQIQSIKEAVFSLAEMSYRHELVKDAYLQSKGVYKLPVDNYLCFYVIDEEEKKVMIVRVISQKRDWINLI